MLAPWILAPVVAASVAASPPGEKSYPLAGGLTYGLPVAFGMASGMVAGALGNSPVRTALVLPLGVASLGSLSAGYVYAGDPARGALVILGELGVVTGSMLVSGGIAVLATGGGQAAGFLLPLIGTPIVLGSLVGYEYWKLGDLHELIDRKNAEARKR